MTPELDDPVRLRWVERLAIRYSVASRQRKADALTALMGSANVRSVLLVGVEAAHFDWSNIVERAVVSAAPFSVATGLGPTIGLGSCEALCDGRHLPFTAKAFDLAVSNAVIEHVGGEADQRAFVDEHHRVARRFVVTTPNLWFPVESHTRVLLRHWLPAWRARPRDHFTRLLTKRSLRDLLPATGTVISGRWWSATFLAVHECDDGCLSGPS